MSEPWVFLQHDALWGDPSPRTPEGQRLWQLFRNGKLGPSSSGIRDFGQRICQIEAEAAAPDGLSEAWEAVEAVLPEGWGITMLYPDGKRWGCLAQGRNLPFLPLSMTLDEIDAAYGPNGPYRAVHGYGPTHTAALLALRDQLAAKPGEPES